jgi:hypothetical protein
VFEVFVAQPQLVPHSPDLAREYAELARVPPCDRRQTRFCLAGTDLGSKIGQLADGRGQASTIAPNPNMSVCWRTASTCD